MDPKNPVVTTEQKSTLVFVMQVLAEKAHQLAQDESNLLESTSKMLEINRAMNVLEGLVVG